MNLPELHTCLLRIKCVNMCESAGVWLSVRFHRLLSQGCHGGHVRVTQALCVEAGEREFKGGSFPGSPGIRPPNIRTSITNNQDQTAGRSPGCSRWCGGRVPIRVSSVSVVVYLSLGTALANQLPVPVHFPLRQV